MAKNISRRTFLKGSAALTGAAALGSAFNIYHPEGAFAAEDSPLSYGYSYCDMCNHTPKCGIKATLKEGKIIRIESRENYPNGRLCAKGVSSIQELYDPERLLHPVIRTNPKGSPDPGWKQISWEEAYETIAKKFNGIKAQDGADKVMFYCGDPKEPRSAVQRLAYTFGSPNYGNESSTCFRAEAMAGFLTMGKVSMGTDPGPKTRTCLIWSLNPAWSLPTRFGKLCDAKANGTQFIVVDPRVTPTVSSLADIHLQLRPGTDGALALGIAHVMLRDGYYDQGFVEKWTHGFTEFAEYVKEFTPEKTEEITWVPKEKIEAAAKMFGQETPGTWIGSASPTVHSTNGTQNTRAILSVVALSGNIDAEGGLEMPDGLPFDLFAGNPAFNRETDLFQQIKEKRADKEDFPVWAHFVNDMQVNRFPEYVDQGKIKAMFMVGGNAMMWPQTKLYQQALEKMEFTVAADYYIRPMTHNTMDMVLPAAMCFERMAPFAIFGRTIYFREPIVKPMGESRSDWQICFELGTKLGYGKEFFNGSEEEGLEELLRITKLGITLKDLRANPEGLTIPPKEPNSFKKYESGKFRPDGKTGFPTTSGKFEFTSEILRKYQFDTLPTYKEPVDSPNSNPELAKEFPLILNTGSRIPYYTHSKLRHMPWLNQFMPEPIVRMNKVDATARGLKDGDDVKLSTKFGELQFKLEVTNIILPGMIDVFHGWEKADINLLIARDFDPISGFPPYKEGLCQVSKG
ncbi:molybdopterin-dependent oxidoreductase [Desulfitobacterium sp. PCE1]|uniref:molybdopterin-containing oxidoreductase family protein n=1 Tax=Desulfitobacterium sp. PCE1 TaxID=146907 RepID=UPI00037D2A69|nr:molybdopterin-dependent oxidoreductase [Desulfitobacterium sp. PCE1]